MRSSTIGAVHRYGAALSVAATAVAVLTSMLGQQNSFVGLFLWWAGPFGLFYFGGVYFWRYTSTYRVVGEEILRGVAWYFLSLMAWSIIGTQTSALSVTAFTLFGLTALTALVITLVMIGARYVTGSELKVQSEDGQLLVTILGGIVFGFIALYLSLSEEWGWWIFGLYLVSIPAGLALWRTTRRGHTDALGAN